MQAINHERQLLAETLPFATLRAVKACQCTALVQCSCLARYHVNALAILAGNQRKAREAWSCRPRLLAHRFICACSQR